ncbi:class I histocompatibility antigen, F10 alpha chain-like [Notechis scutatus]|uniref:Class I histocompatibility antigen, F10 alpha chain-like n=1 Tax=Notechis scutatus TaxID=8663 RepID=A0A6J1W860_9SAUR|nr:class I histocompatibility antigen, F10 alpha chain-like [Notechis scutatus]
MVKSKTEVEDGMEMHICQVHGFYPREIDAFWTRDGEVWLQDTLHKPLAPNADGTYHYWLSIRIDPKERSRYRCHVEHDGLQEPLDLALEEPKSNLGIIIGCVVVALVLVGVIAGILVFLKRRQGGYKATPTSDKGSNSSDQGKSEELLLLHEPFCPFGRFWVDEGMERGETPPLLKGPPDPSSFFPSASGGTIGIIAPTVA